MVSEAEEAWELRPGLAHIAAQIYGELADLASGRAAPLIRGHLGRNLTDNPYWPAELAAHAGSLDHERLVVMLGLALSRTQDDKGRVRWTLLGGSDEGPEHCFWRGVDGQRREGSANDAVSFLGRLLAEVFDVRARTVEDLVAAGFRILPTGPHQPVPAWACHPLPAWTEPFLLTDEQPFHDVRFLLTFRPFGQIPAELRARYMSKRLHLLPFPGSLVFWGMPGYLRLAGQLREAAQIPLLRVTRRHQGTGIRIPQSGWIHEPGRRRTERELDEAHIRDAFVRTHRWDRVHRHEDELAALTREDKVVRVLFDTDLDTIGLYDKPLARNSQVWTSDFTLLLDGPRAGRAGIEAAREAILDGGEFGYRFHYPPMCVGAWEVVWHRPLVAFLPPGDSLPRVVTPAPLGVLVARRAGGGHDDSVELRPKLLARIAELTAVEGLQHTHDHSHLQTAMDLLALRTAWRGLGERPLPRSFARALISIPRHQSLEEWLGALPERAEDQQAGRRVRDELKRGLTPDARPGDERPITFDRTATRRFEEAWWRDIAHLAHGGWVNKDNADCVLDPVTQVRLAHHERDLEAVGDYLLARHQQAIVAAGMEAKAWCGELPFRWLTDFDFPRFGGWLANQEGRAYERDLLVVIPGRRRDEAVVLADHYDTAYMEDTYAKDGGGSGARLASHGADDNCSATATLLQAAPIFLELAAQGRLERDVWLLHLTGEEFPADCMGARAFCDRLLRRSVQLHTSAGRLDLSATRVVGVFVMDMIAHNRPDEPFLFQIAPGDGPASLSLALAAHRVSESWNANAPLWNRSAERMGQGASRRSSDPAEVPAIAEHPIMHGEVRLHFVPRSSLYNTDGQIFSDLGVPVVLFMEDYDITREGYHDTHDTVENLDLDYGAAFAAIAIETVASVACAR